MLNLFYRNICLIIAYISTINYINREDIIVAFYKMGDPGHLFLFIFGLF